MDNRSINQINEDMKIDTSEMDGQYLTFWTDKQLFGVPIADVVQIVGIQNITQVPEFPSYAKGIINLRGNIIPLVDVRLRFEKEEAQYDERTCIIVTSIKGKEVGFIVDGVDEVTGIEDDMISPPPHMGQNRKNDYLTGVARHKDRVILLIDTSRMLSDNEVAALIDAAPAV